MLSSEGQSGLKAKMLALVSVSASKLSLTSALYIFNVTFIVLLLILVLTLALNNWRWPRSGLSFSGHGLLLAAVLGLVLAYSHNIYYHTEMVSSEGQSGLKAKMLALVSVLASKLALALALNKWPRLRFWPHASCVSG